METLMSMDMTVVVYATNHLDVKTTYLYGRDRTDAELATDVYDCLLAEFGEDALQGFEILTVVK